MSKSQVKTMLISDTEHLTYSPDLVPNDFWLFPKIKCAFEGRTSQDIEDIKL